MKVRSILLTGDDGYNSIGTRLLARLLRKNFEVCIAATKEQQSGMGGKINLKGGDWGETHIEEVPALWIDGSPVDAVEAAVNHYGQDFDLVISGINLGANVAGSIISSGTFSAAFRALNLGFVKHGLALSWNIPTQYWFKKHSADESLDAYLEYPGKTAAQVIKLAIDNELWQAPLLNINFPEEKSNQIVFTQPLDNLNGYFKAVELDREPQRFRYPAEITEYQQTDPHIDVFALQNGLISITPCRADFLNPAVYQEVHDLTYQLNKDE